MWSLVSVESEGPYAPERLLPEAIKVMRDKISSIRASAQALLADKDEMGTLPLPPETAAQVNGAGDEDIEMADA